MFILPRFQKSNYIPNRNTCIRLFICFQSCAPTFLCCFTLLQMKIEAIYIQTFFPDINNRPRMAKFPFTITLVKARQGTEQNKNKKQCTSVKRSHNRFAQSFIVLIFLLQLRSLIFHYVLNFLCPLIVFGRSDFRWPWSSPWILEEYIAKFFGHKWSIKIPGSKGMFAIELPPGRFVATAFKRTMRRDSSGLRWLDLLPYLSWKLWNIAVVYQKGGLEI